MQDISETKWSEWGWCRDRKKQGCKPQGGGGRVFPEDLVSELGVRMRYSVKARSRRMWFQTKRAVWVKVQGARIYEQLRMAEAQILRLGFPSGRTASLAALPVCPEPGTWLHRAGCWHTLRPVPPSTRGAGAPDRWPGVKSCFFLNCLRERKRNMY